MAFPEGSEPVSKGILLEPLRGTSPMPSRRMTGPAHSPPPCLANAAWLERPETQAVFEALAAAGYESRVVGGAVRNALMLLPVADVDIATPAEPRAVMAAAKASNLAVVETGIAHGTVTVLSGDIPHEVTTLRRDVSTDGRRATVAFTTEWVEDAKRRDFTFNALYCDRHGQVHDPLDGYPDLVARRVRFIGNADQRIAEDYLRILRFFRFHAVLGEGLIDPAGLAACIRGRVGLGLLSAERIRSELLRLLAGPRVEDAVTAMIDAGLLLPILRHAPRPGVLKSVIAAEAEIGSRPDPILRLAALAVASSEDFGPLGNVLRLSNDERDALGTVDLQAAALFEHLDERDAKRRLYALGMPGWRRTVLMAFGAATFGNPKLEANSDRAGATWARLLALPERWPVPKLAVKGADLLAHGMLPGPDVGRVLAELERWWIDADFPGEVDQRAELTRRFVKQD